MSKLITCSSWQRDHKNDIRLVAGGTHGKKKRRLCPRELQSGDGGRRGGGPGERKSGGISLSCLEISISRSQESRLGASHRTDTLLEIRWCRGECRRSPSI